MNQFETAIIAAALGFALAWILRSRFDSRRTRSTDRVPAEATELRKPVAHTDASGRVREASFAIVEQRTLGEFIHHLEGQEGRNRAFDTLLGMYRVDRNFPDLGDFRLGPNAFDKLRTDWILLLSGEGPRSELIGHGLATQLHWDGSVEHLPKGWQGAVRRSYENSLADEKKVNALVGLFIRVQDGFRQQGWAAPIAMEMKALATQRGLSSLIFPLRLPQRYTKDYAGMPFEDFAALRREDGQYQDHWMRFHTRLGAKMLTTCTTSHQHAMPLEDFYQQLDSEPIRQSGHHLAQLRGDWYQVYADLEREFVLMEQGCVWVEHPLAPSP